MNNTIEIYVKKLFDWLISRRICSPNWRRDLSSIHKMIQSSIYEIPEHEDVKNVLLNNIDYYQCVKIVDILKVTEAKSKNIFGRYSSQKMKDWLEIIYLYEKNNNYLAEMCNKLHQLAQYELPILKSKLLKINQNINEFIKKKRIASKDLNSINDDINRFLSQFGINGHNNIDLNKELIQSKKLLMDYNNEIIIEVKNLKPFYEYYIDFAKSNHNISHSLPHLEQILDYDMSKNKCEAKNDSDHNKLIQITPEAINDLEQEIIENKEDDFSSEIDFGDDIDLIEINVIEENNQNSIEEKTCLLNDKQFAYKLISEIKEIEAFYKMRSFEERGSVFMKISESNDEISNILSSIHKCYNKMFDKKVQCLRKLILSPTYFNNVLSQFNKKCLVKCKLAKTINDLNSKINESNNLSMELLKKKPSVIENAQVLKKKVEKELEKYINNQNIRIICDFN